MTYTKEYIEEKLNQLMYEMGVLSDLTGNYSDTLNNLYMTLQSFKQEQ